MVIHQVLRMPHNPDRLLTGRQIEETSTYVPLIPLSNQIVTLIALQYGKWILQQNHIRIHVQHSVTKRQRVQNELDLPAHLSLELGRCLIRERGSELGVIPNGCEEGGNVLFVQFLFLTHYH